MPQDWFGNQKSGDIVAEKPNKDEKPKGAGRHRDPNGGRAARRVKTIYESKSPTDKLDQSKIDKIDPNWNK